MSMKNYNDTIGNRTRDLPAHSSSSSEKNFGMIEAVYQLFINLKKELDPLRRGVLCNIVTDFGIPKELVRLIMLCLNEIYTKVCECVSCTCTIEDGLKQGKVL